MKVIHMAGPVSRDDGRVAPYCTPDGQSPIWLTSSDEWTARVKSVTCRACRAMFSEQTLRRLLKP